MLKLLIDSDILIYCLRSKTKWDFVFFLKGLWKEGADLGISVVNRFEILKGSRSKVERERNQRFVDRFELYDLGKETWDNAAFQCADLMEKGSQIDYRDVLIGTLTKDKKMTLVTMNEKHFPGLKPLLRASVPVGKERRKIVFMGAK